MAPQHYSIASFCSSVSRFVGVGIPILIAGRANARANVVLYKLFLSFQNEFINFQIYRIYRRAKIEGYL